MGPKHHHFGPNGKIDAMAGMRLVLERIGVIPGDVNSDGVVDIDDLVVLIDYLLTSNPISNFNAKAADINNDNFIDIIDLTTLIDNMM